MANNFVNLYCDPPQPKAGQGMRLTVELDQDVPVEEVVFLEKQRIVDSGGGFPELRPIAVDKYFELPVSLEIRIKPGAKTGTSDPITVRKDAKSGDGERPVIFPEQLLFTAYITALSEGFRSVLVRILPPD